MKSNLGKWTPWYHHIKEGTKPRPYGDTQAYYLGANWLDPCLSIEDWGCGLGYLREFIGKERYLGIDGTASPFADVVVDLVDYRSSVPGIFMRGVIEHDFRWERLLKNALLSFTERMCLVLFTPMDKVPRQLAYNDEIDVPDLSFAVEELHRLFEKCWVKGWKSEYIVSETAYGGETLFYLEK